MLAALAGFALLIGVSAAGVPIAFSMLAIGFAGFALFRRVVAGEGGGTREHHDFAHQVAERAEQLRAAAERHGAERVAMIAAVEADQRPAPGLSDIDPILIGDLQRDLDRG